MKRETQTRHYNRILKASRARIGARIVLDHLIKRADFYEPFVVITKSQICKATGLERKAVQRGLKFLRNEGTIIAVSGEKGGRYVPVKYQLICIAPDEQDAAQAPNRPDTASKPFLDRVSALMKERGIGWGEAHGLALKEKQDA